MVRQGFGQANDYSGLFASLYNEDIANRERLARDLEQRNDERQAAKDAEVFSKFQHGDITGAELLAHIRKRISDTAHDPQEQAKWKDALRDYEESIADQNAEDAYAAGGSIYALIAHYQDKKKGMEKGTPAYSQASQRLFELIDKAAADDLVLGAERIQDQIAEGKATLKDLADFYKRQLRGLRPGSTVRDSVMQQLDQVEDAIHAQNIDKQIAEIDYKYNAGTMSATDANRALTTIANGFRQSDPVRYWDLLKRGQSYLAQANEGAIPNPDALLDWGGPGGSPGGSPGGNNNGNNSNGRSPYGSGPGGPPSDFKFITQLDGSEYAKVNCVFASGAMLAQAMGYSGYTGADLRWESGDRRGASTSGRLARAFNSLGIPMDLQRSIGFNAFVQQMGKGAPAVVGGNTKFLPDGIRGNYIGGHMVYVDRYDPQKGFLVYDPAKKNDKGHWWPADVMRDFAWSDGVNNVGFAPLNALANPGTRTAPSVNISVWDKPKKPTTPPNYGVGNDPGMDGPADRAKANAGIPPNQQSRTDPDGKVRPYQMPLPQNEQEVRDQLTDLSWMQQRAIDMADAFARGETHYLEADGVTRTPLTQQSVTAEAEAALGSVDYTSALYYALGEPDGAEKGAKARATITANLLNSGDERQEFLWNRVLADTESRLVWSRVHDSDPAKAAEVVRQEVARLQAFGAALDPGDPTAPEGVTVGLHSEIKTTIDNLLIIADPDADPAARITAMSALPEGFRGENGIGEIIMGTVDSDKNVREGRTIPAVVNIDGAPVWTDVPARELAMPDGTTRLVPDTDAQMTPFIVDGRVVYAEVQPLATKDRQIVLVGSPLSLQSALSLTDKDIEGLKAGTILPTSLLANATPLQLAQLQAQGVIKSDAPVYQRGIVIPASNGVPEQQWFQDPETMLWYKGQLPTAALPDGLGLGTIRVEADEFGQVGPAISFRPGSSSYGYYLPFAGDPAKAQSLLDSGAIDGLIPPVIGRDANGTAVPDSPFLPSRATMYNRPPQTDFVMPDRGARFFPQRPTTPPAATGYGHIPAPDLGVYTSPTDMARSLGINVGPSIMPYSQKAPGFTPPPASTQRVVAAKLPKVTLPPISGPPPVRTQPGFARPPISGPPRVTTAPGFTPPPAPAVSTGLVQADGRLVADVVGQAGAR